MTRIINGEEYEVVWSGGPILPDRPTKPSELWAPPKGDKGDRLYNQTGNHVGEFNRWHKKSRLEETGQVLTEDDLNKELNDDGQ